MGSALKFDGATFDPEYDGPRLTRQMQEIWKEMKGGAEMSLYDLSWITGIPEASVSARLRDFRKERFGGHTVERIPKGNGLYHYKLIINKGEGKC